MNLRSLFVQWRTGFWHLRHGGPAQVRRWLRRRGRHVESSPVRRVTRMDVAIDSPPERRSTGKRPTVACILDEFSMQAWGEAFDLLPVSPMGWRSELAARRVQLLFVESAWCGNSNQWQYQLTGSQAPSASLRELIAHCRDQGIPTVFWNKEDPPHFEDFLETASLFDQVFTTDANKIDDYRERLGHDRVGVLPFAAAEHIHNPARLRRGHQQGDVAFAGTYFAHKFPERREQMDILLGGALDATPRQERGLDIFSRFQGVDARYDFPGPLGERVVGTLDYSDMLLAYKAYKLFLNVNSVIDSPSMCARRIFEIVACGTPVLSTDSAAIRQFFSEDEVPIARTREEAQHLVRALCNSSELRDRLVHRAQRTVWREHTYRRRAQQVLDAVGLDAEPLTAPRVTALVSTNRPRQMDHVLHSVGRQAGVEVQLALVTHGFGVDEGELRRRAEDAGVTDLVVAEMPASVPLGACLRAAVTMADGDVLTKMDDDDLYGDEYLADLLHALHYSGASVVGKQAHYMYLSRFDATLLRFAHREHRWTDMVMGPTITGYADVFRETSFADLATGEDSDFLRRVSESGAGIYSADRFNFVQMRRGEHTWTANDIELLATGSVTQFGDATEHVVF